MYTWIHERPVWSAGVSRTRYNIRYPRAFPDAGEFEDCTRANLCGANITTLCRYVYIFRYNMRRIQSSNTLSRTRFNKILNIVSLLSVHPPTHTHTIMYTSNQWTSAWYGESRTCIHYRPECIVIYTVY